MKLKLWMCLLLVMLILFSSCSMVTEDAETTATTQAVPTHSLHIYTQWIGYPLERVVNAFGISQSDVVSGDIIPTSKTVEHMDMEFSLALLTEKDFDGCFSGVELTTALDEGEGEVAPRIWSLVQAIDDEYLTAENSHENIYTEAEIFTLMEIADFLRNMETALHTRGVYSFEISWTITRLATEETKELLEKMGKQVMEETQAQFEGSTIDFVWSADTRLDVTLRVDIMDKHKAEVTVTCKALAEPAAGMDMDLDPSDRNRKFLSDSYQRLLQEEYLYISGYSFQTAENTTVQTLEEIYLAGDDFVYIIDNGVTQTVYLCADGVQYKTACRNGEYDPWQKLTESIEHPLPWTGTTVELVFADGYGGGIQGYSHKNVYKADFNVKYDDVNAYFWTKANCIYKAEYRAMEDLFIESRKVTVENKRVMEIAVVTEQEAEAAIGKYKAMLP